MKNPFEFNSAESKGVQSVNGQGFSMTKGHVSSGQTGHSLEFRPGETSDTARVRLEEERQISIEQEPERIFNSVLRGKSNYSEVFNIEPDGGFVVTEGPLDRLIYDVQTSADLYNLAAQIQSKHPEYHFDFATDPEGKWIRCTVTKVENKK